MDQHDASLVGMLCLDHIAMPPQTHHRLMASHFDLASDEPSSDDDMEASRLRCLYRTVFISSMCIGTHVEQGWSLASRSALCDTCVFV